VDKQGPPPGTTPRPTAPAPTANGGTVKNETVANLSALPDHVIRPDRRRAEGPAAGPRRRGGHHHRVAAARARRRGARHGQGAGAARPAGPAGRQRDLALPWSISRVVKPGSKLSTLNLVGQIPPWAPTWAWTMPAPTTFTPAMYWLEHRQDAIEAELARRHLATGRPNPSKMALFDLSTRGWKARGARWPPAGYSRTAGKGRLQIEYGLLTDPEGRPVAVRVLPGNTATPPRSPRSPRWCGTSSGWPRWSWSATGE